MMVDVAIILACKLWKLAVTFQGLVVGYGLAH